MPETVTPERIAALLQAAPGWCRVGLAAPTAAQRDRAARELGELVVQRLDEPPPPTTDARQLSLPIAE